MAHKKDPRSTPESPRELFYCNKVLTKFFRMACWAEPADYQSESGPSNGREGEKEIQDEPGDGAANDQCGKRPKETTDERRDCNLPAASHLIASTLISFAPPASYGLL
jgi:hypothetical protein